MRKTNWFQRHINWTVILVVLLGAVLANVEPTGVGAIIGIGSYIAVCAWALKQKNRSLGWFLLIFTVVGLIIILLLKNKRDNMILDMKNGEVITRARIEGE